MPDNISKLYNALLGTYELGSEDDFRKYLSDSKNREALRKELQAEYDTGDEAAFSAYLGFGQPAQKPAQKPAPAQPVVKQTTGRVNPTVNTSTQKQGGWQPTWQEKMGMQMQLDETMRQVKQSQQDFNTRMENIRKGNTLGKTSEVKFNPESGRMERRYYTTTGEEVGSQWEQSRINFAERDRWESTTDEGRRHREKRIQNDFERRVGASLDKYDPDNAAAMAWQQAEERTKADREKHNDEIWSNYAAMGGGREMRMMETGDTWHSNMVDHLNYQDLQRMADDAWNMLGKEKQQSIIEDMYGALKNRYPQATEEQLQQAATEMAREQSDRRMFEFAVEKNAPKSATEYFFRKAIGMNSLLNSHQALARSAAGTTGDWEAREDAEQRFDKQGHKVARIAGTVTGFALDPLTWLSAGAGGTAVKGTTWLGGKMIGEAAMRKFGTTLGGRMLGGAIGGAVNFGTYEAGSEALDQMKWGGYIDEETGERKDGFSFGNVAGRAGHGLMMGAVTGVIAPYLGNVSDKLVRATESTIGKMGIRAGELGVGTVAEGTIFAVPEIIDTYGQYGDLINSLSDESSPNYIADEQERAAKIDELRNSRGDALMDVWTDNMAMIAGFKAQHLLKSAPRVIYDLARSKNGKAGFETRLRSILDGRGDLALTEDEKKELERRGYADLKDLTEEYSRYAEAKEEYDKARPTTTDASRMIEGGDRQAELPYNRFVELMTDNSVSEAARAKMYYYLTGHGLPMSTVMGSSILEDKDADGNVTGYTVQSFGANGVITSRSFGDKKRADVEANRINRQAELNGFDVGERYYDWQGDNKRMYEACESVAEETGAPANLLFDLMKRKTEAMNEIELEWAEKILNAYNGLGDKYGSSEVRAAINEEFGVDVDKAIRKEPGRRSEQEQKAVDEYANRLFADVRRKQEEAAERGEAPSSPDAPTSNSQIAALLGIDDGEQGDPVSAAFNRGHEADAQERQDISIELADPNNAEAQEAWNGVVQRINEDAAYMVAQQREQTKKMQHTDGSLRPAILKEKDSDGNDQQVYIVDGNVQMMPDGSVVDKASSDNIVVIYNPATDERKQIDPSADTGISSLGEVTTAEQREADIERSRQEYVQAQIDEAQGTVRLSPGQQLVLPTGEEAVVVATDADGGNITVALGDGTQATVQRSELQRIRDEKGLADYRKRHGITEEPAAQQPEASMPAQLQADGRVAGAPADYTADMELTIRDEDGIEKPAMVMGRVRYENGSFVPDANGNIIEYFMDGEVKHDHEDKLVDKVVSHVAPAKPEADIAPTATEPQPQQADEERVIREGIAGVGEGLRDAVNEQAARVRENDINNWLQKPTVADAMRKYGEGAQSVEEVVQRALADNPNDETKAALGDIMRFDSSKQLVQGYISQPQPAKPAEAHVQSTEQQEAEPMPVGEDGEEDWHATTPERAHTYIFNEAGLTRSEGNEFIAAQIQAAQTALRKASSANRPKIGTSIDKYNEAKAKRQGKIDEAQRVLDYWNGVREIKNAIQREENERRAADDAVRHDEAVAAAQAEYEARKQAEEERKAVGNENPMPAITEKWNNATKVDGHSDEIMLPDGTPLKGHYVLHESGASSPSHNSETWQKTDGFPMDSNDNSVNDRDYERDHDAQEHTQSIARQYDQRALQSVPVVSNDGVVLSGNGRTMAGQLAARDNTDSAYVNYLKEYAPKFGFTPELVEAMQHPRVSFVPDEAMPYTAETFAKFNQQDMKSQNKTEQAVKLGKTVGDDVFKGIVRTINGYDTLGDFYNDADASLGAVYDLHNAGVVPQAQLAEMVDGIRGQEKLSAVGREFMENMLIGKAFEGDPDVVRMLTSEPSMRQSVITALGEIADNIAIGRGYSLQQELADAVKLCFDARKEGAKQGDIVSIYAKQGVLFADPDQLQTVADFNNATMLMLADVLNDKRVTLLKITLQLYNNDARESAARKTDMFAGGIRSREAILRDVINFIRKNYGKGKEIEAARAAAVERRKAESIQQNGTDEAGIGGSENTGGSGRNETAVSAGLRITDPRTMSDEERQRRGEMLRNATAIDVEPNHIVSTKDKTARKAAEEWWDDNVGDAQWYETEAGEVEINRNSIESSLAHGYGQMKLDAITSLIDGFSNAVYLGTMPDSTHQDGVLNHYFAYPINYKGKRSYVFCRALHDNNTNRLYVHEVFVEDKIKKGNTLQTAASQPHGGISLYRDILANVLLSDGKESENPASDQAKGEKVAENQSSSGVQAALEAAEQETNTEPTEAQKKAGNYKMGHVRIDGFDVTIENPKGSVRRGTDASGKQWEQEMQNTYGYIRGTEGVDGDHIDVFFSEDPSQGDVFIVDQVNKDGSFDEHKVMYGFPDIESARKAYLANYEDGWTGLGAITPVSKEEFKKWVQSSRRKTKPFSEYSSVKPLGDTQLGEQPTAGSFGPIYTQFKGRAREAIAFLLEKKDGEAIAALHHKDIGDIDLVWGKEGTGKSDGYGLAKLTKYHPEVLDNLQELLDEMVVTNRSENRVQLESETHQASVRLTWDNEKKNWLLTAFEKKNSALDNTTDTGKTSERGKRNDTATPQSTVSEGKGKGNSSTSQAKGEKVAENQVASGVEGAMAIVVEDVMSFPKEIREEDTISKEQNSGKRGDRIKVKAGLSGNDLYIQYKSGRSSKDKRRWATIKIPNATNYSAGQIIYRLGYIGTFTDIERLSGDAVLELFNKNGLRLHKGGWKEVSPREDALRDALVNVLRGAGVDVVTDVEEGQRVLDEANGETRLQAKKRALETASLSDGSERSLTVVSSADGAKVLRNLDKAIQTLESSSTQPKTFVGDIANSLGAQRKGSKSEYATFETKNGRVVTIRLADHNATVSNFDNRGELDGISIVVSPKKSAGVTNDGDAHVVEYYYDAIKLRKADGKPLADIVRSIKQALYSGEFEDTTGLAERQEVNGRELMKLGGLKMQKKPMAAEDQKHKETQLSIINDTNPAPDDYHTWVRSIDDILTLQEAVDAVLAEDPEYELSTYPDVSDDIIREALRTGRITIYSSKPIKNGVFVTPSMMQAMDYSGGTKVFSKEVPIRDVAWINTDEGQYTATSGEATSKDKEVRFFRTPDGHAYGFTKDGKIYIDPRIATAETPIHEYSHLWASAFRKANPKEWANIVELMKGTTLWEEVKQRYPELKTEDEIADEVLAHYSGRRGAERLRAEREKIANGEGDVVEKAKAISALERVKDALKRFWKGVADWLGIHFTSAEEVAEKVLADMLNGVNPAAEAGAQRGGVRYEANSEEADIVARAKADGTYMKAPNGKPSLLSQRQWVQVRTRSFKEWFGDWENDPNGASKVLDENGEPKVVLHGTPNTFTAFDKRKIGSSNDPGWLGSGFYFYGNNEDYARSYSRGGNLMELFLNIRDPYYASYSEMERLAEANNREASDEFREMVEDEGCDGVYYNADINEEWVAFEPSQIKSATDNVGTFDGSNPDIRYQFVGEKGAAAMDKAEEASVRLDNLSVAREMEAAGKDAKAVKLATVWERGADGKWRYEIEDFDNSGLERVVREDNQRKLRLSEQRRSLLARKREMESEVFPDRYFDEFSDAERHQWYMEHSAEIAELEDLSKEIDRLKKQENSSDIITDLGTVIGKDHVLLKYYPELEGFVVHITYMPYNVGGHYGLDVITLNREAMYDRNTLNHEVQHAIQEIEGFARGGSVRDVRNRIMKRIAELDNVSEHAKEMLARQVEYRALASKLGYVYERLMKNGEDWAVRAASDNYWEAMNTLDNDENSQLNNVYPKGKNASEIAKDGFNRDKAIEELNRLSDYYASQISAEDMKDIKESEALSGKINGKSDEELYHALGGEVEARNVQSRLSMTSEERRASLASETEDVAREDQIFLNDGLGVSMSESASETDLEDVNRRFNDELGRLTEENKDKVVLSLGRPSAVLLSAGVEDKPMKLYGNKVMKKMKKHGFSLAELEGLPRAVADPIAVFDNIGREGNRSILTELRTEQGNFLVTVDLGKGLEDIDFNIISSVFGKRYNNVVDWINKGYARYINKEKALDYLHHSAPIAEALSNPKLDSAAKVVKEFENPKVSDTKSEGILSSESAQASAATTESTDTAKYRIREDEPPRTMQEDRDMMRSVAEQMGEKLHTNIHIIEDVNEITHPNSAVQERRRRSKGWYDTKTGQVNIVLPNNRSVDDVKASVGHETIAHKGLRELIGEENYDAFLDEVYEHLRGDLKQQVDTQASRAFIDDATRNGERAKSYEQHRRTAVDELFGRLAEKPFEEFAEGERTLWQKIKEAVRKVLDEFLGTLNLPKWFELGDNELRYILWRSKERLERGREHPIDLARDIVKREELGLTDEARYNMGDAPETFKARQRRAVENKGTVMPGLNDALVKVVDVPRHQYQGRDILTQARNAAIERYSVQGDTKERELKSFHYDNFGEKFDYVISPKSLTKAANHAGDSDNIGVHAAVMDKLDEVINESVEIEEHPDIKKKDGERKWDNGFNKGIIMHRFAAAVRIGDEIYRVKTTMKEYENPQKANGHYTYEVTKIEVLDEQSNTPNGRSNVSDVFVSGVKLLNNLEKSYDSGKKILDESKLADESADLYREVGETDDIWSDGSLGLHERMTAAAARLSANHKDNKTLRNDAMRAICANLDDLAKSMLAHPRKKDLTDAERMSVDAKVGKVARAQKRFDMTTVKRVADLARVLITNGYINNATSYEIKRLLSAVKNSVGHNDIEGDVQKVMDIMVDNQLKHAEETLHSLEAVKGSKVDARGVEVQGELDPDGQTLIKAMKEAQKIVNPCGGKTHDEKGEPTAWGNALESAQMRMSSKTISLMESG